MSEQIPCVGGPYDGKLVDTKLGERWAWGPSWAWGQDQGDNLGYYVLNGDHYVWEAAT